MDSWKAQLAERGAKSQKIEVMSWLSRATLDIIGIAGEDSFQACRSVVADGAVKQGLITNSTR